MAAYYEMAVCDPDMVPKIDPNNPPFPGTGKDMAGSMIMASAKQIFAAGQKYSGSALQTMHDVAGYLSQVSGERVMVLASPGFLTPGESHEVDALIDIAVRNQVVINTLDARGLYTGGFSIKKHASIGASVKMNSFPYPAVKTGLVARGASAQSEILASLAAATGGTFFESNNDLKEGFHQVSAPAGVYVPNRLLAGEAQAQRRVSPAESGAEESTRVEDCGRTQGLRRRSS